MVVFTCSHCGESLQKPKVEKHYLTTCRKAPKSLTCVDCFKDFKGEEYATHVKCVTEEERYAAKGSFPKGNVKKGEVKQESWTEIIKSVVETTDSVKPGLQQIFTIMSSSANVPRKKSKFVNFIKSASGNKANNKDVEDVWDIIEKHKASQQAENATNGNDATTNGKSEDNDENKVGNSIQEANVGELSKKKKKKSKNLENKKTEEETPTNAENNLSESVENKKKKKKKCRENEVATTEEKPSEHISNETSDQKPKKKNKSENPAENKNAISGDVNVEQTPALDSSKKKKRKSKDIQENETLQENNVEDLKKEKVEVENQAENVENNVEGSKKKKRKSKQVEENGVQDTQPVEHTENNVEGSKKKKRKTENGIQTGHSEGDKVQTTAKESKKRKLKDMPAENEEISETKKIKGEKQRHDSDSSSCGFCYKEQILEVMKSKKNISIEKLEKKVLKAYQELVGKEPVKATKKFKRHLKKISNLEIIDDNVRLIEN